MRPKVLVFGGTHGNEWTGVMAVTRYKEELKGKYQNLDLEFILANPEAYKLNKRFKDEDLNRAFQFLKENRKDSYEHHRAREIKQLIGSDPCFVIDLHTTTSNMGPTVIVAQPNRKNLYTCALLKGMVPDCRIIISPDLTRKYLVGQSDYGLMIEVGPVANGVVDALVLEKTLEILHSILVILMKNETPEEGEMECFEEIEDVYYPEGTYIHSSFQGKDFRSILGAYTPFKSYDGKDISRETLEELFPIFINEAAYYPQKLAYTLCRKINKAY